MTSRDFVFWLQGFLELTEVSKPLSVTQVACVQKHLALVFIHEIDPSMPNKDLDKVHNVPGNSTGLIDGKMPTRPKDYNGNPVYRC